MTEPDPIDRRRNQPFGRRPLLAAAQAAGLAVEQGRRTEAYDLLAPIDGWFTERLDTPGLRDAKALLDELS